jgi:hypothetical protein
VSKDSAFRWARHVNVPEEMVGYRLARKRKRHKNPRNGQARRKRALIQQRGHRCESCQLTEWLGGAIPIELHHMDGDPENNAPENLQVVCPNCHALTQNYCGKAQIRSLLKAEEVLEMQTSDGPAGPRISSMSCNLEDFKQGFDNPAPECVDSERSV